MGRQHSLRREGSPQAREGLPSWEAGREAHAQAPSPSQHLKGTVATCLGLSAHLQAATSKSRAGHGEGCDASVPGPPHVLSVALPRGRQRHDFDSLGPGIWGPCRLQAGV